MLFLTFELTFIHLFVKLSSATLHTQQDVFGYDLFEQFSKYCGFYGFNIVMSIDCQYCQIIGFASLINNGRDNRQ